MRKRRYSMLTPRDALAYPDQSEGTPLPMVHNIVATSQIKAESSVGPEHLDLQRIHEMLPFSFYDQQKFAAITVRLHQPDCTTLLFSSGKLVVTGCRTWYECVYASLCIAELLSECLPGHAFRLHACDVQNMVAHVEIPVGEGGSLDLQAMYTQLALNCTYQRKMFPGLIYRPEASPVVLLCFVSGKVVITGGKTMDDVFSGWNRLWPTLRRFIVPAPAPTGTRSGVGGGEAHGVGQGLPLEGHTAADHARGGRDGPVEVAGCGVGREQVLDLTNAGALEGFGDDLAAEGAALGDGRAVTEAAAGQRRGHPGAPHASIVEAELVRARGAAELEAGVVLLDGHGEADKAIVGIAQVLAAETGGLAPHDREALVHALEEQLRVAKRVRTHAGRQPVHQEIVVGGD